MSVTFTFAVYFKEYPQNNLYRVPPTYSPVSSQVMHPPQPALWGYSIIGQTQHPGFFVQNQPLPPGMGKLCIDKRVAWCMWQKLTSYNPILSVTFPEVGCVC